MHGQQTAFTLQQHAHHCSQVHDEEPFEMQLIGYIVHRFLQLRYLPLELQHWKDACLLIRNVRTLLQHLCGIHHLISSYLAASKLDSECSTNYFQGVASFDAHVPDCLCHVRATSLFLFLQHPFLLSKLDRPARDRSASRSESIVVSVAASSVDELSILRQNSVQSTSAEEGRPRSLSATSWRSRTYSSYSAPNNTTAGSSDRSTTTPSTAPLLADLDQLVAHLHESLRCIGAVEIRDDIPPAKQSVWFQYSPTTKLFIQQNPALFGPTLSGLMQELDAEDGVHASHSTAVLFALCRYLYCLHRLARSHTQSITSNDEMYWRLEASGASEKRSLERMQNYISDITTGFVLEIAKWYFPLNQPFHSPVLNLNHLSGAIESTLMKTSRLGPVTNFYLGFVALLRVWLREQFLVFVQIEDRSTVTLPTAKPPVFRPRAVDYHTFFHCDPRVGLYFQRIPTAAEVRQLHATVPNKPVVVLSCFSMPSAASWKDELVQGWCTPGRFEAELLAIFAAHAPYPAKVSTVDSVAADLLEQPLYAEFGKCMQADAQAAESLGVARENPFHYTVEHIYATSFSPTSLEKILSHNRADE